MAAFVLQSAVVHRLCPGWGRPDLICLLAAFIALEATAPGAFWSGLALGILRDLGSAAPLGSGALAMLPAVALLLGVRDRFYETHAVDVGLALVFVLTFSVLEAAGAMIHSPGAPFATLSVVALGQSLFSAALAFPVFVLLRKTGVVRTGRPAFDD
jgi:rod shape-determining protein MreD